MPGTDRGPADVEEGVDVRTRDDRDLVAAARRGSRGAAAELARRHWEGAWRRAYAVTGRRALAEDVAQEAVAAALGRLDDLADPAAFGAWLARIATRRAIDALRAERRRAEDGELPDIAVEWTGTAGEAEDVRAAVAGLSPDRRVVVVLRFWLQLTPSEIAETLEVPVGTVNSRLARALADLRGVLEESSRA
jgi:RNA polymerase sigma-70 factor (ECF subfamily)